MNSYEDRFRDDILGGRFEFKQTGTFREINSHIPLKTLSAALISIAVMLLFYFFGTRNILISQIYLIIVFVICVLFIAVFRMIIVGKEWRYTANNKCMSITKKGETRVYKYKDIEKVSFVPRQRLFKEYSGYDIFVQTKYVTHRYRYISPQKGVMMTPEVTPFFILQQPPKEFNKDANFYR